MSDTAWFRIPYPDEPFPLPVGPELVAHLEEAGDAPAAAIAARALVGSGATSVEARLGWDAEIFVATLPDGGDCLAVCLDDQGWDELTVHSADLRDGGSGVSIPIPLLGLPRIEPVSVSPDGGNCTTFEGVISVCLVEGRTPPGRDEPLRWGDYPEIASGLAAPTWATRYTCEALDADAFSALLGDGRPHETPPPDQAVLVAVSAFIEEEWSGAAVVVVDARIGARPGEPVDTALARELVERAAPLIRWGTVVELVSREISPPRTESRTLREQTVVTQSIRTEMPRRAEA